MNTPDPPESSPPDTMSIQELRRQIGAAARKPEPSRAAEAAAAPLPWGEAPPADRPAGPLGRLVYVHPPGGPVGREFPVGVTPLLVGRDRGCDVVCPDESVSRRHARVDVRADGKVQVTDLGSANGTFVNRVRVKSAPLRGGDQLQLGNCVFWFLAGPGNSDPGPGWEGVAARAGATQLAPGDPRNPPR
jgi:hypothetical protein